MPSSSHGIIKCGNSWFCYDLCNYFADISNNDEVLSQVAWAMPMTVYSADMSLSQEFADSQSSIDQVKAKRRKLTGTTQWQIISLGFWQCVSTALQGVSHMFCRCNMNNHCLKNKYICYSNSQYPPNRLGTHTYIFWRSCQNGPTIFWLMLFIVLDLIPWVALYPQTFISWSLTPVDFPHSLSLALRCTHCADPLQGI